MPERYYTPCNVGIYIGGYKLSDAFRVDWDARDSKTPLYGWADDTFSAVTNGRKIISGRLVINYKHPGYLTTAIDMFNKNNYPILDNRKEVDEVKRYLELDATERVKFLAELASKNYGDDQLSEAAEARGGLSPSLGIEAYKQNRTFDILVSYGDIAMESHIETIIKNAYIVGQSQVISASATGGGDVSSSGSPIYEIYSFFAKEILENGIGPRKMDNVPQRGNTLSNSVSGN
jgi:hypothetical protein